MKIVLIAFSICIFSVASFSQDKKAIFLVHSTGTDLFSQGKVSDWMKNYNAINNTNFQIYTRTYPENPWPWSNYPHDYWKLWVDNSCNSNDPDIECLASLSSKYDMVIFKHCYPGADVEANLGNPDIKSSRKSLENYKLQYRALRILMDGMPDKKFMVWTLVPRHRLATYASTASRANEFVNWVKTQWLTEDGKPHPNIYIFDFFSFAAEMNKNPSNGVQYCLKYDYEYSHSSGDSHPNVLANQTIGPLFAQAVVKALSADIKVTSISISSITGENAIYTDKGILQMQAMILPIDASNKMVNWSVVEGTGQASISSTGQLIAEKDGTVKVIATANDGSGTKGEFLINISGQIFLTNGKSINGLNQPFDFTVDQDHSNGKIRIHSNKFSNEGYILEVRDILGQQLIKKILYNDNVEFPLGKPSGRICIITIRGKNIFVTKKIIY